MVEVQRFRRLLFAEIPELGCASGNLFYSKEIVGSSSMFRLAIGREWYYALPMRRCR